MFNYDQEVNTMNKMRVSTQTPLAVFVRERLAELGIKQSDFCRLTGFDQGLLSKIQSSMITNLTLESALRLASGLCVSPKIVLELIDRMDLHELVMRSYAIDITDSAGAASAEMPAAVTEITHMALRAHLLNRSLKPVLQFLYPLAATSRVQRHRPARTVAGSG
jgi:transcriptional regulator with XRE-family HTH domain